MSTVYAVDIRRKLKVRYLGVVHYAATETVVGSFSMGTMLPRTYPFGARCGTQFDSSGETPAYLESIDDAIVVTCIACMADRRRG